MLRYSILVPLSILAAFGQPAAVHGGKTEQTGAVARGKYLVEDVVMCEQCHTRRMENGQPAMGNWLQGGPVQIKPTYPAPNWAVVVPRIAGGPPGTDADFIRLMTTGIARTGKPPRPPMLRFHMTQEDAEAVLAYLKTLAP